MKFVHSGALRKQLGPETLSDRKLALGFSWLSKKDTARAETGNCLVRFCLRLLDTAGKASSAALAVGCGASGNIQKTWAHPGTVGRYFGRQASGSSRSCACKPARRLAEPPERSVSACTQLGSSRTALESQNGV